MLAKIWIMLIMPIIVYTPLEANNSFKVDRYKAVFNRFPKHVSSAKVADAPITGNGDIGLTMSPTAGRLDFYVGKNDFWKAVESYPDGKIMLPGGLSIVTDIIKENSYYAEQLPGSAEINALFSVTGQELRVKAWVPALDNLVVIELEANNQTKIHLKLWTYDGYESRTSHGVENGFSWVHRSFDNLPYLKWPTFMAMAMNLQNGELTLKPRQKQTIVLSIYTNHDTQDWHKKAIRDVSMVTDSIVDIKKEQHGKWWNSFWSMSSVSFDDDFLEKYYYQSQYLFACSSREGKFAPGLWGPFITSDNSAWCGDYHLNYNFESSYWACFSSNHISLTENYDQPMLDYMESGRKHARNLYNCRGILYPVGLGPKGLCSSAWPRDTMRMKELYGVTENTVEDGVMLWQQKTNASFVASNMMMHFYSTYSRSYAAKIYPFLLACADFWEDYLIFEDGRYVVKGDTFYETKPWKNYEGDFNCILSLGMARMIFKSVDDLSRFLNKDRNRRAKWNEILHHLSNYPVGKNTKGRISLKYCENENLIPRGIGRIHIHGILLPTCLIGPNLTPEYNNMMLKDLIERRAVEGQDWGGSMSNGIETIYPAAARVGYPAKELLQHLKERIKMGSYPNCFICAEGGGVETLSAVPGTINEMMMQSYEGIVRIFPNWDRTMNGSFNNLRAYGAFLVSSELANGQILRVVLKSEKGRPCKMENPWPSKTVGVKRNGKLWKTMKGNVFEFNTNSGDMYEFDVYNEKATMQKDTLKKSK